MMKDTQTFQLLLLLSLGLSLPPASVYAAEGEQGEAPTQSAQGEATSEAAGEEAEPTQAAQRASGAAAMSSGWRHAHLFALRYNPLGLQDESFLGYRWALRDLYGAKPESRLLGKTYLWTGAIGRISPQFAQLGGFIKALPVAVLELQGSFVRNLALSDAERVRESGIYTEGTKDALDPSSGNAGSIIRDGWQASLQARFQIKVGSIAVRNTNLFRYFDLEGEGPGGNELFYDQTLDVITPLKSWVYQNDTDILYAKDGNPWILGARYTVTSPQSEGMAQIQRAGPLFVWKFLSPAPSKSSDALIVLSQWHIEHRSRTGQSMNQLIPYFAVLYSHSADL